jgi:hypothetical protein
MVVLTHGHVGVVVTVETFIAVPLLVSGVVFSVAWTFSSMDDGSTVPTAAAALPFLDAFLEASGGGGGGAAAAAAAAGVGSGGVGATTESIIHQVSLLSLDASSSS